MAACRQFLRIVSSFLYYTIEMARHRHVCNRTTCPSYIIMYLYRMAACRQFLHIVLSLHHTTNQIAGYRHVGNHTTCPSCTLTLHCNGWKCYLYYHGPSSLPIRGLETLPAPIFLHRAFYLMKYDYSKWLCGCGLWGVSGVGVWVVSETIRRWLS